MKLRGESTPTSVGLIILVLIYVLLIGIILVFSGQIIANITIYGSLGNTMAIIAIAFILPLVLLGAIIVNMGKTEAILPRSEQIPGEHYQAGERIRAIISEKLGAEAVIPSTHPAPERSRWMKNSTRRAIWWSVSSTRSNAFAALS